MDYKIRQIITKGKKRKIVTYVNDTKRNEHNEIKEFLDKKLKFSKFTKAYISKSSIYKNAKAHMYNDIFLKYDIKSFFENIDHRILVQVVHEQLNLGKDKEKYSLLDVAKLVNQCIYGSKGLPLGLITSPILANIYLKTFDNIIYGKFKKLGLDNIIYTRYADDLTVSYRNPNKCALDCFSAQNQLIEEIISKQLKKYKLTLNHKKKSVVSLIVSNHVRVTGLSITELPDGKRKLSVGKKKINQLYDDALELFNKKNDASYVLSSDDFYNIKRIKGMESFILSVHKVGYNDVFSSQMKDKINKLGFNTLHDLIKSLG